MKKILIILACSLSVISNAQDIITKTNGDELKAKVTEITKDEIKYKRFDNPEGPVFILNRNEVFMIKYENGTKDIFTTSSDSQKQPGNVQAKNASSEIKPFKPALYGGMSLPVGAFGSETDEDGSAAKTGFCFGHYGLIGLNNEQIFFYYDLSFNLNPYKVSALIPYQSPYPPYNISYELLEVKGNYMNNLVLSGFRYVSPGNSPSVYLGFGVGLNVPVLTGYLKDEANVTVKPGMAMKFNAGVMITNHFDIGIAYLYTRPKWEYTIIQSPSYNYVMTADQKVSALQITFGYAF